MVAGAAMARRRYFNARQDRDDQYLTPVNHLVPEVRSRLVKLSAPRPHRASC